MDSVCNHKEELWDALHHQQNSSMIIDQEYIIIKENMIKYDKIMLSWWTCSLVHQNDKNQHWRRNQSKNELFIKSFINNDWRIIKEERSWSYAWKSYHKGLWMIQESFITIQDMISANWNQTK